MIWLKYLISVLGKIILFPTVPVAAFIIPIFTRAQKPELDKYTWGGLWGTFDNPPQGDRGFVNKRSLFPGITTGLKGYANRVMWLFRNPLYGYSKLVDIKYEDDFVLTIKGTRDISDKYKRPGWRWATLRDTKGKLVAFEWYSVTPYTEKRNVRIRLGWKIVTDKMQERGWARMVFTINPVDSYGDF